MPATAFHRSAMVALASALLSLPAWATSAGGAAHVPAVWVPRHIQFVYMGFTTHYSCDGLRDKIRHMLWKLGARHLKVREEPCSSPMGRPGPFPGVRVSMQVLVPAAQAGKGGKSAPKVQAHWHTVVLAPSNTGFDEGGDCELIGQFKRSFLPLFATRDIRYHTTCIPHQVTLSTYLSAEVLAPDHPAAKRS